MSNSKPSDISQPLVSIITPAYNARNHLPKLIECLQNQSVTNWELVCVDDVSTDGTWEFLQQASQSDSRILIHRLKVNSGSAKIPRDTAAQMSNSLYVCPIDADDWVEPLYIEKLIQKQKETQADMVLSQCIGIDDLSGRQLFLIPDEQFNFSTTLSAEEAFNMTLRTWQITASGALIPKQTWCNSEVFMNTEFTHLNADEFVSRELLGSVGSIACSTAKYFYRMHSGSVTHDNSRTAEQIYTDYRLYQHAQKKFDSKTVRRVYSRYIECLFSITKKILRKVYPVSPPVMNYIEKAFSRINIQDILRTDLPISTKIKYITRLNHYKRSINTYSSPNK